MANIKKLIALAVVIVGVFFYASQSTSRSLYSTKADASSEYIAIGKANEQLTIIQTFIPDNSSVKQLELLINTASPMGATLNWRLETTDAQQVASGSGVLSSVLNDSKNKVMIDLGQLTVKAGETYVLKLSGPIGGVFYQTYSRFSNQTVRVNEQNTTQSLVAKVVYQGLHIQTFAVLLGLITYIVLFMSIMLKLFR